MPYRICKSIVVESGHMLAKHPDKCQFPHGHTRQVEFVLEADDLDASDMVCDFKVITTSVHELVQTFDHSMCMNTDDPLFAQFKENYGDRVIGFEHTDPTTEVIAKTIYDAAKARLILHAQNAGAAFPLRPNVRLVRVRVWETGTSWAEYAE
ncbi:MAG TPA: 6-carboxytetrahydropterin synthase [Kiritimatiellia bacterium]|nr:6-carboxytetrahydropterin synthase [Kiritimatiellia bacterium]HMO97692.1 6-carboxytetrahydropterin synthase [Kiritimatiellia bacterium]HMP95552.1 6-carboxytetrahydropterin synthase [Kiritimatiellia bacterium]